MKLEITTGQVLKIMYIISWVIFIGLCIEAGGFIANTILTLVLDPAAAKHLWQQADLSSLYIYDVGHYVAEMVLINIVAVLKALLFYLIIKILHDKKLSMSQPFSPETGRFISRLAFLAIGIGLFCLWGINYTGWLVTKGVKMPEIQFLRFAGADVWLFMGVILFVIAQMFKRGIEIQSENDLTI